MMSRQVFRLRENAPPGLKTTVCFLAQLRLRDDGEKILGSDGEVPRRNGKDKH